MKFITGFSVLRVLHSLQRWDCVVLNDIDL